LTSVGAPNAKKADPQLLGGTAGADQIHVVEIPGDLDEKLIWQYRNMLLMSVGPVLLRALA
jgi:hypothetical protein